LRNRVRVELRSEIDAALARGAGGRYALTAALVTSTNSPYAVRHTDVVVEFDESNGALATAVLPTGPTVGERHTFVWWGWVGGSPPPLVEGGGSELVPYAQGVQSSKALAAQSNITSQGGIYSLQWDGSQWMLVGAD